MWLPALKKISRGYNCGRLRGQLYADDWSLQPDTVGLPGRVTDTLSEGSRIKIGKPKSF